MIVNGEELLSNESNSGIKEPIFNPVKQAEGQINRVWSSESVQLAHNALNDGFDLTESPFNKRVSEYRLRAPNLTFRMSNAELEIFKKLKNDKILFGNTVMHLKDEAKGWQKITLRDYQEDLLTKYTKYNRNILMFPRQSGKTTTTIVEIVHFMIFNYEKDCVVVAQSETVVEEILSKIKQAFSKLPFFLQPGFKRVAKDGMSLDNGCRLKVGVASESVVQGFSLDFLFVDEFAYIAPSRAQKFWINVYPALVNNPKSKVIIASTPNGRNLFYELWMKSINKENNFVHSRVYWHEVPRSIPLEQFKKEVIADIGLEGWLMGFECSFDTQLQAIFSTKVQQKIRKYQQEYENKWSTENDYYGMKFGIRFIDKSIINYNLTKDYFLLGVDIGEGLEQDSSVIKIRKLEYNEGKIQYRLVGIFQDNTIAVDEFAERVMELSEIFEKGKFQISVENNNYGGEFFNQIKNLKQNSRRYMFFDMNSIAKFRRDSKNDYDFGYRINKENKKSGVSFYRRMVNNDEFDDFDSNSIDQMMNFGRNKNGTYAAQYGHDDLVMADIAIALLINSNDVFNTDFIRKATFQLKLDANDYNDDEVIKHFENLEAERKANRQLIETPDGMTIRDSRKELAKKHDKRLVIANRRQMREEEDDFLSSRGLSKQDIYNRRR